MDHENKRVFTGDTLLVRGCGRTDFQGGSSEKLYDSVHEKLFKLPRDYTVYPAHDYQGRTASSIGEEMDFNPRLSKSKSEFIDIMAKLNLSHRRRVQLAAVVASAAVALSLAEFVRAKWCDDGDVVVTAERLCC